MDVLIAKKEVNRRTDNILSELNKFTSIKNMNQAFGEKNKIGRSQLAALLSDARNASSIDEIKLYISYKKAKGHGWDDEAGGKVVADHLIESLREVEQLTEEIKSSIELYPGQKVTIDDLRELKLMIAEKFLGYLYWKGTELAK